ncbi:MAG: efflux RND transporter periplasmic adaptor subunit [Phycisphaerales bacterium]|nr:efflux RND transporter periplasmic adaptor subunit [Phycisphaerales bacterium]
MKRLLKPLILAAVVILLVLAWLVHFHNGFFTERLKTFPRFQKIVAALGNAKEAVEEDEDPNTSENEIPVHTTLIQKATLRRYVEGVGIVTPRPARQGQMAGGANIASATAGVVSQIFVQVGRQVKAGDVLIQLDDRLAKSAEEQAAAGLRQAEASLAIVKGGPRPEQLEMAELAVAKSQATLAVAQRNYERVKELAADQTASAKSLEQAAFDLAAAKADVAINEKQLHLLKNTPAPEELALENAKVAQAAAALAAAKAQRELLTILAPIDATVTSLSVNPGEAMDTTRGLIQLIAMDRLMVDVDVPADQLPPNAADLNAEIFISSTAAPILAKVTTVTPQVDPKNGSVMLAIDLPSQSLPDGRGSDTPHFTPGLSVRVRIIAEEHKDVLAVPKGAVVADENGDPVIALVDGDQATHKTVKTGLQENNLIEIIADDLHEGDKVVTAGAYGLPQATRIKVVD